MSDEVKQFKDVVSMMLPRSSNGQALDESVIDEKIYEARMLPMFAALSDDEVRSVRNEIHAERQILLMRGTAITRKNHKKWLAARKASLDLKYWGRFKKHLIEDKGFPRHVVDQMDDVSDEIVDLLGDPAKDAKEQRRGLIIGDVQSGKTVNYSGIICKAVDSGYRTVILLTGTSNELRRQTQVRLDEAFIGMDSAAVANGQGIQFIGVGKHDPSLRPSSITTTDYDFSKSVSKRLNMALAQTASDRPMLFVIKKNTSVLKHLFDWIKAYNQYADNKIDNSLLLIDDEADYASVNTRGSDDPAKTNEQIVNLLNLFSFSSYVGFTATPYANVFIDPQTNIDMENENLFPGDYIYALEAPTDYIGARNIFGKKAKHRTMLRDIEDAKDFYPIGHKKDADFRHLSPSLKEAIRVFLIANAVRDLRGDNTAHRSMMVNVSRFIDTQNQLRDSIQLYLDEIKSSIKIFASLPAEQALDDPNIKALFEAYEKEFHKTEFSWIEVQEKLFDSVLPTLVFAVNGKSTKFHYDEYADGLRAIVVGGQALSRGLTLEGLIVSYIYRNSMAYDTLMQMGRWFGYRKRYDDLCRIYMDLENQEYYAKISEATDELRSEIKRMRDRGATPLEFGLKVRNDPEIPLIVTARNKMRSAISRTINQSLSGAVVETPYLYNNAEENNLNLNLVRELISDIQADNSKTKQYGAYDIASDKIVDLLNNVAVPGSNTRFDPKSIASFIEKYAGAELGVWDVVIISGDGEPYKLTDSISTKPSVRSYDLRNDARIIRINGPKTRIGSPTDPSWGLTDAQKQAVKQHFGSTSKATKGEHFFSGDIPETRNRKPLLMIYLVQLKSGGDLDEFGLDPLVGFAVGIPYLSDEETKYIRYQTNIIHQALGGFEDESDEGEE